MDRGNGPPKDARRASATAGGAKTAGKRRSTLLDDLTVAAQGEKRTSVFDTPNGSYGGVIKADDVADLIDKQTKKIDVDGFHELLKARSLMNEDTIEKCELVKNVTADTSVKDFTAVCNKVNDAYKTHKNYIADKEYELIGNITMCSVFTTYCCLCTAFTSCCIGPYYMYQYSAQLEELTDEESFRKVVNQKYLLLA